jgi:hypothetical protein
LGTEWIVFLQRRELYPSFPLSTKNPGTWTKDEKKFKAIYEVSIGDSRPIEISLV